MASAISSGTYATLNAKLTGSTFTDVCLGQARFDDVNLAGTTFHNVDLSNALLDDVNLSNVAIRNANLEGMTINGILVTELLAAHRRA